MYLASVFARTQESPEKLTDICGEEARVMSKPMEAVRDTLERVQTWINDHQEGIETYSDWKLEVYACTQVPVPRPDAASLVEQMEEQLHDVAWEDWPGLEVSEEDINKLKEEVERAISNWIWWQNIRTNIWAADGPAAIVIELTLVPEMYDSVQTGYELPLTLPQRMQIKDLDKAKGPDKPKG